MNILNNGRFGMGACLTGTMRMLIAKATDHANTRKQFISNLREYQGIQQKIARMNLLCYANEVRKLTPRKLVLWPWQWSNKGPRQPRFVFCSINTLF